MTVTVEWDEAFDGVRVRCPDRGEVKVSGARYPFLGGSRPLDMVPEWAREAVYASQGRVVAEDGVG